MFFEANLLGVFLKPIFGGCFFRPMFFCQSFGGDFLSQCFEGVFHHRKGTYSYCPYLPEPAEYIPGTPGAGWNDDEVRQYNFAN